MDTTSKREIYQLDFLIPGGQCPYAFKQNTNGANGIFQSGVNSQLTCQNRCNGNGLAIGLTCYAYDFNTLSRLCYIYTSNNYVRNPEGSAPGVNHYVKNCDGASGNQWSKFYLYRKELVNLISE